MFGEYHGLGQLGLNHNVAMITSTRAAISSKTYRFNEVGFPLKQSTHPLLTDATLW